MRLHSASPFYTWACSSNHILAKIWKSKNFGLRSPALSLKKNQPTQNSGQLTLQTGCKKCSGVPETFAEMFALVESNRIEWAISFTLRFHPRITPTCGYCVSELPEKLINVTYLSEEVVLAYNSTIGSHKKTVFVTQLLVWEKSCWAELGNNNTSFFLSFI